MQKIFFLLLALFCTLGAWAQKDNIERTWYNAEKTSKIQVYKATDGKFYGKIVWLQKPNDDSGKPRTDIKNTNEKLRTQPLLNALILKGFSKSKDDANVYEGGTVYDPNSGKTYCGKLTLNGKEIKLKGFICGFSLLGRSSTWTLAE
ncbi:DUF2147 domain-containing protein [Filimonas effusa]|uniref:DUF2147 domain-containing protein n=1 Tax=Filimonas effusa TaxID=2508721 RepID=A0A4Q1D0W5_9BACT|nr:DUF2147 domain-containing protein [Filimonas effusa]RXK81394.1 DUF2147 domain-containing protein [Filimonas effusa]